MYFQALEYKGNHFLDLLDNNYLPIKPTYTKDSAWLKLLGHLNSLCVCVTRAIINHISKDKYHLKFFPRKNFNCPYGTYPIKSRHHILHEYRKYNNYCYNLKTLEFG